MSERQQEHYESSKKESLNSLKQEAEKTQKNKEKNKELKQNDQEQGKGKAKEIAKNRKELKDIKEKFETVESTDKRASSIFDKATKIKPDKFKKSGLAESTDAYAGYTRKRGTVTYELHKDYSNLLIIKEPGKSDCAVSFWRDEIKNKSYIVVNDREGKRHDDKEAIPLAKKYVTQFKNALKIHN